MKINGDIKIDRIRIQMDALSDSLPPKFCYKKLLSLDLQCPAEFPHHNTLNMCFETC
jgi:hypothetical protein